MYEELIAELSKEMSEYEESIRLLSVRIKKAKEIYDIVLPKKVFNLEYSTSVFNDDKMVKKINGFLKENDNSAIADIISLRLKGVKNKEEANNKLLKKGIMPADDLSLFRVKCGSVQLYDKIKEIRALDEVVNKVSETLFCHVNSLIDEMYKKLLQEKEKQKSSMKLIGYAVKSILKNDALLPRDIANITNVIDKVQDENKRTKLFSLLNKYIETNNNKKKTTYYESDLVKKSNNKTRVTYSDANLLKDMDIKEDEDINEDIYDNYLLALKGFNNYDDVAIFLDSIKGTELINITVKKLLNRLSDSDDELREYLLSYASKLDNDIIKDNDEIDDITVLYYGFNFGKNKILDDIQKQDIPSNYYQDVLKGINMIEKDGAINKRTMFTHLKKLFKVRIHDIRITYKRLDKNLYIIYGVFCKKDNRGLEVVSTTMKRDSEFMMQEESIINLMGANALWQELINTNDSMAYDIKQALGNSKVKK